MANALGTISQPDDTLAKLLATYQAPDVTSGGGALGTIAQAKLGASTAQPTLPEVAAAHGLDLQTQDPVAMPDQSSILGSVGAPSQASQNLTAAENKRQADTPTPYDYHAHGWLGNVGHVLGRIGNITGDILDPEATSLIPNSDLFNARRLAGDNADVQQQTENVAAEKKEQDAVDSETANRQQRTDQFDAEAPERTARVAEANANTQKATTETNNLVAANKPLDSAGADKLNKLWGTDVYTPGMSPQEINRTAEAQKVTAEMKDRKDEFNARLAESSQTHRDAEADRALSRQIAQQNHNDAETDKHTAAQTKANQPYQDVLDNVDEAKEFAAQKTGYGDYGLVMKFVDATKPKTGFKFNQTESGQIYGARSIADKFRVAYESGKTGTLLSPTQRTQILEALDVPKNAAMKHMQSKSGGSNAASVGSGAPPAGATIVDLSK